VRGQGERALLDGDPGGQLAAGRAGVADEVPVGDLGGVGVDGEVRNARFLVHDPDPEHRHRHHLDHAGGRHRPHPDLSLAASWAGQRPLHRHADRRRRHHSVHLVGQRRKPAPRHHPDRVHWGTGAGTPTTAGTFSFTVKVTDASGKTATQATSITIAGGLLAITAPASTALPSTSPGGATSVRLGTVTVTDNRGIASASWTATVTGTTFVTGGGTAAETIPLTQVTYWAGPATATTGTGTFTPGQASATAA
jgi:hypothetical protein